MAIYTKDSISTGTEMAMVNMSLESSRASRETRVIWGITKTTRKTDKELFCILMERSMREAGETISGMDLGLIFIPMAICIEANGNTTEDTDKGRIHTRRVECHTKDSGSKEKDQVSFFKMFFGTKIIIAYLV